MIYANSAIRSFIPPGGVCKGHFKPADTKSKHPITGRVHLSIECAVCEPFLEKDPAWNKDLKLVPLTEEEQKALEAQEHEANKAMGVFGAEMFESFQQFMKQKQTRGK